jgi:crossover junction endodeoxyribonuclease RuvC
MNRKQDRVTTSLIKSRPSDRIEDRIEYITHEVVNRLRGCPGTIVGIAVEGLAFGGKGARRFQLAALHYNVRNALYRQMPEFPVSIISPSELKKFVTGRGNAPKSVMMMECALKFGYKPSDDNVCDAYCLARFLQKHEKRLLKRIAEGKYYD